ncbi:MAG: FAD-dependent monooxygenase [Candidatus Saccharibacteria bacterium]|nr:FAD-dependent monooxygenase [Pseudorhodobacter sp.]
MGYRIGITGAGIGGLAAAALLARSGHRVTLAERFATPRPVGSGLVVQPVGMQVLEALGAGQAARKLGAPLVRMIGHAGGRRVLDVQYRTDAPGLAIHRASLFGVLWDHVRISGVQIVTGAAVTGHDNGWLRRGPSEPLGPFDLIVDASGAGSVLSPLKARKLGFGAVWATVPWPQTALPCDQLTQRYFRASRMAGVMPIGQMPGDPTPLAALFWSQSEAEAAAWAVTDLDEWKAETAAFWPEFAAFTAPLTRADLTQARYAHGSLPRPYDDGIAFIGDAAHRASPQLGQGANMALLDAMALTRALNGSLPDALPRYAAMRRWHRRVYQGFSAMMTPLYQSDSHLLPTLRDWALAPAARLPGLRGILTALVSGDVLPPLSGEVWP